MTPIVIDFDFALEQLYHDEKETFTTNVKLRVHRASETKEQRKERLRIERLRIEDKTRK